MGVVERLDQFIQYKTGGSRSEFADMLGWTRQYLNNLLSGKSFAYKPIEALLKKFPELDARWLILGEGEMILSSFKEYTIKKNVEYLAELEKLMPYMSQEQLDRVSAGNVKFTHEEIKVLKGKRENEYIK